MNSSPLRSRGYRFPDSSEILLFLLMAMALVQIGVCLNAGRGLLPPPATVTELAMSPGGATNAPLISDHRMATMPKSPSFPSATNRG